MSLVYGIKQGGGKEVTFGTIGFSNLGNGGGTVNLTGIAGYQDITNLYVINAVSCGNVTLSGGTQSGNLGGYVASYTAGAASATVACSIIRISGGTTFSGNLLWIKNK